jgi:hypothetical protein
MSSELEKGVHEIRIFKAFCLKLPNIVVVNIVKCVPPEPDLHCVFDHQPTYFELARNYPKSVSQQVFDNNPSSVTVIHDSDMISMLKTKLGKHYLVNEPIHLLLYDDLDLGVANNKVIKALKTLLRSTGSIQYEKIWYFAQGEAIEIYSQASLK